LIFSLNIFLQKKWRTDILYESIETLRE